MKKCPNCQSEIQENARFCLYCMTPLEKKEEFLTERKTEKKKIYIFVALLTVLILIFVALFLFGTNSAEVSDSDHEIGMTTDEGISENNSDFFVEDESESNENSMPTQIEDTSSFDDSINSETDESEGDASPEDVAPEIDDISENSSLENDDSSEDISLENNGSSENDYNSENTSSENDDTAVSYESPTPNDEKDSYGTSVGDIVFFGNYEQDNNSANGAEKIKWKILDIQGDKALIISKYAIDSKKFDETNSSVLWENCTLRSWLNDDFYHNSFNMVEKSEIQRVTLSNNDNPYCGTEGGNDTTDKVFLLSFEDVEKYFSQKEERMCFSTAYAILAKDVEVDGDTCCSSWWLRSPGDSERSTAYVNYNGNVGRYYCSFSAEKFLAVRPALWVDLQYLKDTNSSLEQQPHENTETEIKFSDLSVGDVITFGKYEQDGVVINGKENIEWEVLEVKDGKALIISKYLLDYVFYNDSRTDMTWEDCTLRKWLNGNFYSHTFNAKEKTIIQSTTLVNTDNPYYGTDGGNNTTDKVFILSVDEVIKYYAPNEVGKKWDSNIKSTRGEATCKLTRFVENKFSNDFGNYSLWWLRTPGTTQYYVSAVREDGNIFVGNTDTYSELVGIRPAMWINIK